VQITDIRIPYARIVQNSDLGRMSGILDVLLCLDPLIRGILPGARFAAMR